MTTPAQSAWTLFAIMAGLAVPRSAAAQTQRRWDAFAAYSFVRDATQDLNLPAGWAAGGAIPLNRWFSIVADAGGSYKTVPLVGGDIRVASHAVMAGGRASIALGRLVEFGQIVMGPVHTHGTAFGMASSVAHVAAQGGVGVDIPLRPAMAARLEFDTRILRTGHEFRMMVGLVYEAR